MTNEKFSKLFKKEVRKPETKIQKFHMDIAASIQKVTEKIILKILKSLKQEFNLDNLCLAGGCCTQLRCQRINSKRENF